MHTKTVEQVSKVELWSEMILNVFVWAISGYVISRRLALFSMAKTLILIEFALKVENVNTNHETPSKSL